MSAPDNTPPTNDVRQVIPVTTIGGELTSLMTSEGGTLGVILELGVQGKRGEPGAMSFLVSVEALDVIAELVAGLKFDAGLHVAGMGAELAPVIVVDPEKL